MTQKIASEEPVTTVVLRLLSGALRGGEFVLGVGTTLFVVSPPDALQRDAGQADFPDNALFIPADEHGGNFEVDVTLKDGDIPLIVLHDLSEEAVSSPYVFNTVHHIGGLDIALRPEGDAWSADVLAYSSATPVLPALAEKASLKSNGASRRKYLRITGWIALLTLLMAMAAAMLWTQFAAERATAKKALVQSIPLPQTVALAKLLSGVAGRYRVLPGRDGLIYIFAADERDAAWARQAVARSSYADKARVLQKNTEHARIARLLDGTERSLVYHILRLDNPARPELWLSLDRDPRNALASQALAQRLTALLPYAETVGVQPLADATVLEQAEAGLERLGVRYKKITHDSSVTMSIHGALADGELQKIRTFVEGFYRQWGTHYIYFSVEMEGDLHKGKSFEYGSKGYVKSAASHWDFSV